MSLEKIKQTIISSWSNTKKVLATSFSLVEEKLPIELNRVSSYIPYGNGRSYGDCALNNVVLKTSNYAKIILFDAGQGVITCQSGVLLEDVLKVIVPEQWFFFVTPGTKYVTVGGAVAADVHGKNHYKEGCFSDHIKSLKLALPNGEVLTCSEKENVELFKATCGGNGLTGVILEVTFNLKRINSGFIKKRTIKTEGIAETLAVFEENKTVSYMVAWIDGLEKGKNLGKSLVYLAEHASDNDFNSVIRKRIKVPFNMPGFILNKFSIKVFNCLRFYGNQMQITKESLDVFFYPLDNVRQWNKIYGAKGFLQYQFVIPKDRALEGILEILKKVEQSSHTPFLNVLKLLGEENKNYLSFPLEGYTLALDFKKKKGLIEFLNELDTIVAHYRGRVYLAKDGRMSKTFFEKGYPEIAKVKEIRKKHCLEQLQSIQSERLGF